MFGGMENRIAAIVFGIPAVKGVEFGEGFGAARLRGFAPKTNMHTYRTFGNMLGMVFVHSFDRSVRVYEAMILRGFSGRFQSVTAFRATSRDAVFAVAAFACMVCLVAFDLYLEFPRG